MEGIAITKERIMADYISAVDSIKSKKEMIEGFAKYLDSTDLTRDNAIKGIDKHIEWLRTSNEVDIEKKRDYNRKFNDYMIERGAYEAVVGDGILSTTYCAFIANLRYITSCIKDFDLLLQPSK